MSLSIADFSDVAKNVTHFFSSLKIVWMLFALLHVSEIKISIWSFIKGTDKTDITIKISTCSRMILDWQQYFGDIKDFNRTCMD